MTRALVLVVLVAVLGAGCAQVLGIEDLPGVRDGGNDDHGLAGHLDLGALAIDTDQDRRVVYGGSTAGVVYIRKP